MVAKTYIIAEIGINHEGNVYKCLELIKKAKLSGVNAVKLQTIDADLNYSVDTPSYKIFKSSNFYLMNIIKLSNKVYHKILFFGNSSCRMVYFIQLHSIATLFSAEFHYNFYP